MRALLLSAFLLTACATGPLWVHPTKTEADFNSDSYACEKDAAAVQNPSRAKGMMERCMQDKGWREKA